MDLVVVRVDNKERDVARRLRAGLRVTDSACLSEGRPGEIIALVDCDRLDRGAFETRLSRIANRQLSIGWARFPNDGYTLASLVAVASLVGAATGDERASTADGRVRAPAAATVSEAAAQ